MRAGIATTLVVIVVTAAGCGGGGANTLSSAVSSATSATSAAKTGVGSAAQPAARVAKSKLSAFCRRFNKPLAPLPGAQQPELVRASAQRTITQLLPFSIALGRAAARVPDPQVAALSTQYNDLTGIYQALVTAPAKPKLQQPLVQRAAKGVVVIRATARQAGLRPCAASFA